MGYTHFSLQGLVLMIDSDKCEEVLVLMIELEKGKISSQAKSHQTHFQPFLDDFHVGKTTHQACFVFGKERLELSILSELDFESSMYAISPFAEDLFLFNELRKSIITSIE